MREMYVRELSTGEIYKAYDIKILNDKTRILIWRNYWKWIDIKKVEPVDENIFNGG